MLSPEDYMFTCLNKKLFGVECLGCGAQRATVLLFEGDFISAFKIYPAIYPLLFLFLFIGITIFIKFKFSNKIISTLAIISVATIIVSYLIKITH